jgi:FkbM family methyltransferase
MSELETHTYKNYSILFRAGSVDQNVLDHSFDSDIFFSAIREYQASPHALVIDVGAHIGTFSLFSIIAEKASRVIALEPNLESFNILLKNVNVNGFQNKIVPLNYALADVNGEAKLFLDRENWGHSLTNTTLSLFQQVKTITLDSLFEMQLIGGCDLIKFNCEGAEFQIVLSLKSKVLKNVKMLLILFHEDLAHGFTRVDLIRHLKHCNFQTRLLNVSEKRGWIVATNKGYYSPIKHQLLIGKEIMKRVFLATKIR